MSRPSRFLAALSLLGLTGCAWADKLPPAGPELAAALAAAEDYLARQQDDELASYWIYKDADDGRNHFVPAFHFLTDEALTIGQACADRPAGGWSCCRVTWTYRKATVPWTGVMWHNSRGAPTEHGPPVDLRGASRLRLKMRTTTDPGMRVRLLVGLTGPQAHIREYVTPPLGLDWQDISVDLQGTDLQAVICPFGFTLELGQVPGAKGGQVTFDMDEVQFEGLQAAGPALVRSFEPHPTKAASRPSDRSATWLYDQALLILTWLGSERPDAKKRAADLCDALLYAQSHDRTFANGDVLRDAYANGSLADPETGFARLPGWWDGKGWAEDAGQVSITVGNLGWAMIALLHAEQRLAPQDHRYRDAALRIGEWIEANCRVEGSPGGYRGGLEFRTEGLTQAERKDERRCLRPVTWRSTEHALDLVVAFTLCHRLTQDRKWLERARHASEFVGRMWLGDRFATGTDRDADKPRTTPRPLDAAGSWPLLVFGPMDQTKLGFQWAVKHCATDSGFDFNDDRDATWTEGTGQMGSGFAMLRDWASWRRTMDLMVTDLQTSSGGLWAASGDDLTTGLAMTRNGPNGEVEMPWHYQKQVAIASVCWFIAGAGRNIYWDQPATAPVDLSSDVVAAAMKETAR